MRRLFVVLAWGACAMFSAERADAQGARRGKPWCAPEVFELSDHVCFFDGGPPPDGRRTLVVYLHGVYGSSPGFQWLQQRAMAIHAMRLGFTVLLPTAPRTDAYYQWPTARRTRDDQEPAILATLQDARAALEKRLGHGFDETFVVGFSSGAYYGSSLALRGAFDVDGYVMLAGGSSWVRGAVAPEKRVPIFVGISAADSQTAAHSRALAGLLAGLGWPYRAEERRAGHMVDWALIEHGVKWLRSRPRPPQPVALQTPGQGTSQGPAPGSSPR
jgi:predicted esterase